MTKLEQKLQIAIKTDNFTTSKRYQYFYQAVAKHFKDLTGWFDGCVVHHIDENPCNNHPSNLKCMTNSEHAILHSKSRKGKKRGIPIDKEKLKELIMLSNPRSNKKIRVAWNKGIKL